MRKRLWSKLVLVLLVSLLAPRALPGAAAPAQQTNLLTNGGFESPYNDDGSANGWVRWDRVSSADKFGDCTNGYRKSPRWGQATDFVHSGSSSQYVGNNWDTWSGGVWQTVNVVPGTRYQFSFYGRGYGSMDSSDPSNQALNMKMRAGIDPNGSGLWSDADVVWSATDSPHDRWQQFTIEATATGDKMTVFTSADWAVEGVNQCYKFLNTYFDSAQLVEVAPPPTNTPPPPPPPPPATNTPLPPTNTPTPEATATFTPTPTITPSPTPAGGTICVNAFADANANGTHDESEGFMAGVTFTVANSETVVGQGISAGSDTPVCFDGLAAGSYQVAQIVPGRLEMTTAANTNLDVAAGQTYGVEFGSRLRQEGEPTATSADAIASNPEPTTPPVPETAASQENANLPAIIGLSVLGLAVVLLGVLIFLVLRRQAA